MRAAILIVLFTLTAQAQPPPLSSKLLEQCDAGVAKACFEYSLYLQSQRDPKAKQLAAVYMSRACTMAYAPACTQRARAAETVGKENPSGPAENADVEELLAHRNQVKDTIDQIQAKYSNDAGNNSASADSNKRMSVIERMGFRATPFMLKLFGKNAFMFTSGEQ